MHKYCVVAFAKEVCEKLQADLAEVFRVCWAWTKEEVILFWW